MRMLNAKNIFSRQNKLKRKKKLRIFRLTTACLRNVLKEISQRVYKDTCIQLCL